jgi:archaeal type IV pilus assembly protein PilA
MVYMHSPEIKSQLNFNEEVSIKKMNNIKRFMKNRKAISPIFATLILIAIAVIAGVVVYAFTSGYLSTMTNNTNAAQEKVTVQGVQYAGSTSITVYAQNMASTGTVTINGLIIKDAQGSVVSSATSLASTDLTSGDLKGVTGTISDLGIGSYTATLTSTNGGSFVSPSFTVTS